MADEYRQLKVSADQIDNAVNWVEANKDECFDRIAAAEERLDGNSIELGLCFDRISTAEIRLANLESEQVEVDSDFSDTSENPVQNKVITEQFSHYYTTTETDEKITEKVSEIVAGAPEDFNTLKEMSDWLTEHEDSAATMNSAIQKNAEDIAKKLDADGTAVRIRTVTSTSDSNRAIIFSDNTNQTGTGNVIPCVDPDFYYNSVKNTLTVPNIESDTINKINTSQICENLIPFPYYSENGKTTNGALYTYDDIGIITVDTNGIAVTANAYFGLYNSGDLGLEIGRKYTLSAHIIDGTGKCSLYFANTLSSGSTVDLTTIRSMEPGKRYASTFEYSQADLFEKDTIGLYVTPTMGVASNLKIAVMLEEGEIAHSYQPYNLNRKSLRDDISALIALME